MKHEITLNELLPTLTNLKVGDTLTIIEEKPKVARRWEDLDDVSGWFVGSSSTIHNDARTQPFASNKNVFPTKADAESAIALAQLLQLRKQVVGGWMADWSDPAQGKYCIARVKNKAQGIISNAYYREISFETREQRDTFMQNHIDLLNTYFKIS